MSIRYLFVLGWLFCLLSSCTSTLYKAEQAERKREYLTASSYYATLYRQTPIRKPKEKAYMAFHTAENLFRLRSFAKALNYYRSAERYGYPDSLLLLRLGQSLQTQGEYLQSLNYFQRYQAVSPQSLFAQRGIEGCRMALSDTLPKGQSYLLQRADRWNSSRSDYAPVYAPDGSFLIFSSHRNRPTDVEVSAVTGELDGDLYSVSRDQYGQWAMRPDTLKGNINTTADEAGATIAAGGDKLYYTYLSPEIGKAQRVQIYESTLQGKQGWSGGRPLDLWGDSTTMAAHPSLSPSGQTLYFVSDKSDGLGGKDIYLVRREGDGWSKPELMSMDINTLGDELFPVAVSDSLLYFASDGHPGLGGFDLYKAQLLPSGRYLLTHLPAPLNSSVDDLSIAFDPNPNQAHTDTPLAQSGLLASSRGDSRGYPHLYSFSLPSIQTLIEGYVSDREGYAISGAMIRLLGNKSTAEQVATTGADGSFRLVAEGDVDYVMLAGAKGYLNQYVRFRTDEATKSETYSVQFSLTSRDSIEALPEVYYAFDQDELLPTSMPQLRELLTTLQDNPDIRIELMAHTDRRGSESYNQDLSERRAKSVVRYLVEQGIATDRLLYRGYGKTQPYRVTTKKAEEYPWLSVGQILDETFVEGLTPERQEVCDALNRRTEFRALSN